MYVSVCASSTIYIIIRHFRDEKRIAIIAVFLVSRCCVNACLVSCSTWSDTRMLAIRDSAVYIRVRNGDVLCQRFAFGSREERCVITAFVIVSLLRCRRMSEGLRYCCCTFYTGP